MRENKFKYYWQHDETGRIVSKIFTLIEIESGIVDAWNNKLSRYGEPFKRAGYTGLKDKNGIEICEGDILNKSFMDGYDRRSVVVYSDFMWRIESGNMSRPIPDNAGWCSINEKRYGGLEVIGNIYENPELLEAKS